MYRISGSRGEPRISRRERYSAGDIFGVHVVMSFGITVGSFWDHVGIILGSILWPFWDQVGITLGPFGACGAGNRGSQGNAICAKVPGCRSMGSGNPGSQGNANRAEVLGFRYLGTGKPNWLEPKWLRMMRRWIRRQYRTSGSAMGICSSLREPESRFRIELSFGASAQTRD